MPDIKWIKITTEMFDDEKIRIIEAMPEADTLIVIWIRLICMAGKVNAGGHIFLAPDLPYNDEELASIFNRPLNTVRLAIATFQRLHMINISEDGTIFLPHFEEHQSIEGMERAKENTRKRVAAFRGREKRKLLASPEDVTLRNVTVTQQIRLDKNRIEESREDDVLTIWNNVLLKLQQTVSTVNFETWLKDTICVEINDDEIIIGVMREDQAAYIETNQPAVIENIVAQEVGKALQLKVILIDNE